MIDSLATHPCLSCGACCAYFRVSFYTTEMKSDRYLVPAHCVTEVNSDENVMSGTDQTKDPRCIALKGTVGKDAHCSIYENRPSPCRKFNASFEWGVKEARCDEARAHHGLQPLTLRDYDAIRNRN